MRRDRVVSSWTLMEMGLKSTRVHMRDMGARRDMIFVFLALVTASMVLQPIHAVKFPNDIEGQPEIECGDTSVRVNVKTTNGVASKLYAKGHSAETGCSFEKINGGTFNIGTCGMNRQRQLEPRGISYGLIVVVQLHPMFVTKVDRAYSIRCFYMETEKIVTSFLDVSMISTQSITGGPPMPVCNYELHAESPNGPNVRYARVGDKVWHTWTCPSSSYGMLVHSCVVTDGQGNDYKVMDERGCSKDEYVLRTPDYSTDLTRVQQETQVFKFADKAAVVFNCQIKLCQKAENGCETITPPNCASPPAPSIESEPVITGITSTISALNSTSDTVGVQNSTVTLGVTVQESNATDENRTSVKPNFPKPHEFPISENGSATNLFINNTDSNSGEKSARIFANESQANSTVFNGGLKIENETSPTIPSVWFTTESENSTVIRNFTQPASEFNSTEFENTTEPSKISDPKHFTYVNLTSGEGYLLVSKHGNLSSTSETVDGVTEIASGDGMEFFDPDTIGNDTAEWDMGQNETSVNLTLTATVKPLSLINATVIILDSNDDGRSRRNLLSPLLAKAVDATNELIKREDDEITSIRGNSERRLRDEIFEPLPSMETDVQQQMWVMEPEEGTGKDGHPNGKGLDKRSDDKSLNGSGDENQWPNGRVCLSNRTVLAIFMPLLAMMLTTIASVILCMRRFRSSQSKFVHFRQTSPLTYLHRRA